MPFLMSIHGFLKKQGKLFYLCIVLFLLLLIHPYFEKTAFEEAILSILLTLILASTMYALSNSRKTFIWSLVLGAPWIASMWFDYFSPLELSLITHSFGILFYGYIIVILIRHIMNIHTITKDEIYGGIAVYLLIGMAFSAVYSVVNMNDANSFYVSPIEKMPEVGDWSDFLYFSFTTLTTLGYGDILPITPVAKSLVNIESIIGVLYVAVMIARLVGIHTTNQRQRS
jgi:voltage-gated potassium channel